MKTKFTLVALGVMLLTVGCSNNTPTTAESSVTSASSATSQIAPKTRSEKVKDAASNISDIFRASRESIVSKDTTFVVTLTNVNVGVPGKYEITNLGGIISLCSYKVNLEDEMRIAFSTVYTSGELHIGEQSLPLAGLGFNFYLLDSTAYIDLSNQILSALLVGVISSYIEELTPQEALELLENIIGPTHKTKVPSITLPLMEDLDNALKQKNDEIDEWYTNCDFSVLEGAEYSFLDSGFSFIKRQSGILESTLTMSKSAFYALAIAGAKSDEELVEITKRYDQITKIDTSIGIKTDDEKRLSYVSTYLNFERIGDDPIAIEGSIKLEMKYGIIGISLPKTFNDFFELNIPVQS